MTEKDKENFHRIFKIPDGTEITINTDSSVSEGTMLVVTSIDDDVSPKEEKLRGDLFRAQAEETSREDLTNAWPYRDKELK